MPITLSNTSISGLGVGGLPSGSVTAATLASSAVTSSKVGYTGAVVQVQYYSNTAQTNGNSVGYEVTCVSGSITPQFSTSKILVIYSVVLGATNNQPVFTWVTRNNTTTRVQAGNTAGPGAPQIGSNGNSSGYSQNDTHWSVCAQIYDNPATTATTTYYVRAGQRKDSDQGIRLNFPWNYSTYNQQWQAPGICQMILMEIKQ